MASKVRRGSVLRRGSMVNVAVPKLARRLELQNCFDGLKEDDKETVDRQLLSTIIRSNLDTTSYFTNEQYKALSVIISLFVYLIYHMILQFYHLF